MIEGFHLLRPLWLLAVFPLGLLWWRLRRLRRADADPWAGRVDAHLLRHVHTPGTPRPGAAGYRLLAAAWTLGVVALSGPAWEKSPAVSYAQAQPPLVLVLDLSRSMLSEDLAPTRIVHAQAKARTLLRGLPARPVGVVVFSGRAHVALPLTEDHRLAGDLIARLTPMLMPSPHSRAADGLDLAVQLISGEASGTADVLLVADGAEEDAVTAAEWAERKGVRVSALGVGTPAGVLAVDGRMVDVPLGEKALYRVAAAGGGRYTGVRTGGEDVDTILSGLTPAVSPVTDGTGEPGTARQWYDRGPWFLLPLLPLALVVFRRGWLAGTLLLLVGLQPPPALAYDWAALWQNADQRGLAALRAGEPERAARLFRDPRWRAVALYRAGDFAGAVTLLEGRESADAHFNRGNALTRLGDLDAAADAYRQALSRQPGHRGAGRNLGLVEKFRAARATVSRTAVERDPRSRKPPTPGKQKETPATYAEEWLGLDGGPRLAQPPAATVPPPEDDPGMAAGGALMLPDTVEGEPREGEGVGQSLDDGAGERDGRDRVSRPGTASDEGDEDEDIDRSVAEGDAFGESPGAQDRQPSRPQKEPGQVLLPMESREAVVDAESETAKEQVSTHGGVAPGSDGPTDQGGGSPEQFQARAQWLDRIPDNPAGLLRAKFAREYRRDPPSVTGEPW